MRERKREREKTGQDRTGQDRKHVIYISPAVFWHWLCPLSLIPYHFTPYVLCAMCYALQPIQVQVQMDVVMNSQSSILYHQHAALYNAPFFLLDSIVLMTRSIPMPC
ncbi:hypothetical protein BDF14DRAFT_1752868, partial [Spinellus fusiger]